MRNSSRTWLRRENEAFAQSLKPGSLVLDAGAGDQPYRDLFEHCDYETADYERVDKPYGQSTYVCDLAAIPVENGRFDAIVCNQVLEHVTDPVSALRELNRVLKPGGRLIATAPLFYEEHEQPFDYFRYTQFAWRRMMEEADFEVERLDWMEGYFGTVAYQLETASRYLPERPREISPGIVGWLAAPLVVGVKAASKGVALLFYMLDERARYTKRGMPKNYVVIATKPTYRSHREPTRQDKTANRFNLSSQRGESWLNRANIAADLMKRHAAPGSRIADLGCGDQKLRAALGDWPASYQGYDLIPQAPNVIKIDLTDDTLPECDVTVLLGVLEYIPIPPVLEKVASQFLVISHLYPDEGAFSADLKTEKQWSNLLPKSDFERLLAKSGFHIIEVVRSPEGKEHVWLAQKECDSSYVDGPRAPSAANT